MKLNHIQEKILRMLDANIVDPKKMAEKLGRGYNEFKVQSMVFTLARKGAINGLIAGLVLHGSEMQKLIGYKQSSQLIGEIPECKMR